MEFEEEIQDREYFERQIIGLAERITDLENRALVYGKWPENNGCVANMARTIRKISSKLMNEEGEEENDK